MGRGKIELKRIEDKCSRQVSFSKRRKGIMKKAPELSVLCEVDVALFIFSGGSNRLSEFSSGESMSRILARYQNYKDAEEEVRRTVREKLALEYRGVWTADELTQMIHRHLEDHKIQRLDIAGLIQLEQEIDGVLQQVRTKKTQLMLGAVKALQEKQKQLSQEKQLIVGEIMAARLNLSNVDG